MRIVKKDNEVASGDCDEIISRSIAEQSVVAFARLSEPSPSIIEARPRNPARLYDDYKRLYARRMIAVRAIDVARELVLLAEVCADYWTRWYGESDDSITTRGRLLHREILSLARDARAAFRHNRENGDVVSCSCESRSRECDLLDIENETRGASLRDDARRVASSILVSRLDAYAKRMLEIERIASLVDDVERELL